jgi:hypothetical protein
VSHHRDCFATEVGLVAKVLSLRRGVCQFSCAYITCIVLYLAVPLSVQFAGRTNVNLKDKWRNLTLKDERSFIGTDEY